MDRPAVDRLWEVVRSEPIDPPHEGERGSMRPHLHGGSVSASVRLLVLLSPRLLSVNSPEHIRHSVLELGAGSGAFSFTASAVSHNRRRVIAIEIDVQRFDRMERWRRIASRRLGWRVPITLRGDYNREQVLPRHEISGRRVLVWLNNAEGILYRNMEGGQAFLEGRLRECRIGSVIVALDRLFRDNLYWHEEAFVTRVRRSDISWMASSSGDRIVDLPLYKYTLSDHPQPGMRGDTMRVRNPPVTRLNNPYFDFHRYFQR